MVHVDVARAHRAHPLLALNTLLVLESVWPQHEAYWRDLGAFICRLRRRPQAKLTAVMLSDEYAQVHSRAQIAQQSALPGTTLTPSCTSSLVFVHSRIFSTSPAEVRRALALALS